MSDLEFKDLRDMLARFDAAQVEERSAEQSAAQSFVYMNADAPESRRLTKAREDLTNARTMLIASYSVKR